MAEKASGSGRSLVLGGCVGFLVASVVGGALIAVLLFGGGAVIAFLGGAGAWMLLRAEPAPAPVIVQPVVLQPADVAPAPVAPPVAPHPTGSSGTPSADAPSGTPEAVPPAPEPPPPEPTAEEELPEDVDWLEDENATTGSKSRPKDPVKAIATAVTETVGGPRVTVEGDAKVVLIGGGKRYPLPGAVPPGKYDIEAAFPGEAPVVTGKINVVSGSSAVVACNANMGICRAK